MSAEQHKVDADEAGIRLDRWFKAHYPGLGFGHLQKLVRTGQVRVDGARVKTSTRLASGQTVRIPPNLDSDKERPRAENKAINSDREIIEAAILFEDRHVMVINKPHGLAVQGGSGTFRHVDGMLEAFRDKKGQKPRLVHRLDRDTSGCLLIAKTRSAAAALGKEFKGRSARKTYWALVKGVPRPSEGRISTWLLKERHKEGDRVRVAVHGEPDAEHALSSFRLIDKAGRAVSWLQMSPHTGRTHQLRVHAQAIGHAIIGDPKYFEAEPSWEEPPGLQNKLHLHARRLVIPHPNGEGHIDVTAPLSPHMVQAWNMLSFDKDYEEDDEEALS